MKEFAEAFKSLFDKISDFFDILDLSFFISGTAVFTSILFYGILGNFQLPAWITTGVGVLAIIIMSYLFGLVCFALGRWVRTGIRPEARKEKFNAYFLEIIKEHKLHNIEPFHTYLSLKTKNALSRLYVRLWAEIRQCKELAPSMSLIRRYWVMAATYDGLAIATWAWIAVIIFCKVSDNDYFKVNWSVLISLIALLLIIFFVCLNEANRYADHQVEEIVASIATQYTKNKFPGGGASQ